MLYTQITQCSRLSRPEFGIGIGKRGGSWNNNPANCRAANRNYKSPADRNNNLGFRVVCSVFPALFYRQNWQKGFCRAHSEESRPVPVRKATTSKNKTEPDGVVGSPKTRPVH